MKTVDVVFTGGGTAGHVTPNLALIEVLRPMYRVAYIGSKKGIERKMIEDIDVPYYAVRSGKLRRYLSWRNFIDPIFVLIGILQALFKLIRLRPKVVFSKGGFVGLPVVVAAWLCRIPVMIHESDITPGLANRLSYPFVHKICLTFEASQAYFKHSKKIITTGTPIRPALFQGTRKKGLAIAKFDGSKPCLLIMGGSLGAKEINDAVRESLTLLTQHMDIIHLCGKGNMDTRYKSKGYFPLEYASDNLPDLFAASDVVLSRAGANALYEILALAKPNILIPLSKRYSRGDQIHNARYFESQGVSVVFEDRMPTAHQLCDAILSLYEHRFEVVDKIKALKIHSATPVLVKLIEEML